MRRFVCWTFIGLDVFPLIRGADVLNLLQLVGHEDVKVSGVVPDNYRRGQLGYLCKTPL